MGDERVLNFDRVQGEGVLSWAGLEGEGWIGPGRRMRVGGVDMVYWNGFGPRLKTR